MSDERITGNLGQRLASIIQGAGENGWRIIRGGKESGPFSRAQLIDKVTAEEIDPEDLVKEGTGLWTKAGEVAFLKQEFIGRQLKREALNKVGRFDGVWVPKKVLLLGGCVVLVVVVSILLWLSARSAQRPEAFAERPNGNLKGPEPRLKTEQEQARQQAAVEFKRGRDYVRQWKLDKALEAYDKAVRLAPNNPLCYQGRGGVFFLNGDYEAAIKDFSEVIRLDPTNTQAHVDRGTALRNKGRYDEAIADFEEAIRLDPKCAPAYDARGQYMEQRKEYDKAIRDFDEAIWLDPNSHAYRSSRGACWFAQKQYRKALTDFEAAVSLVPRDSLAGITYERLARLLATCPDDTIRDGERALVLAKLACDTGGGWRSSFFLATLAAAYAEVGQFDTAVNYQRQAWEEEVKHGWSIASESRKHLGDFSLNTMSLSPYSMPLCAVNWMRASAWVLTGCRLILGGAVLAAPGRWR